MLDDFFSDTWWPVRNLARDTFKLDIRKTNGSIVSKLSFPGVTKEEINLQLKDDGRLTIAVERRRISRKTRKTTSTGRDVTVQCKGLFIFAMPRLKA